jgi:hypothetical protein
VVTRAFVELVKTYAFKRGMPGERFTFVPHPITGMPADICRRYLQGNDPVSGKPILQEIVGGLTIPLSDEDKKKGFIERPTPRFVPADTAENLHQLFLENGWTDGTAWRKC